MEQLMNSDIILKRCVIAQLKGSIIQQECSSDIIQPSEKIQRSKHGDRHMCLTFT